MIISKRAAGITPSMTLEITAKTKKLRAEGKSIVGFVAGEPDFSTPQYIIDAAKKALDDGFTKYTPSSGMNELKDAIVRKFKRDNGLDYSASQIIVSTGAKSSIFHAVEAVVEEGDEVIIPKPYWLTYPEIVNIAGGTCVFVDTKEKNDYKITAKELEAAITPKTKLFILNSPCNPSGAVYSETEIRALAAVIEKTDVLVLSDEIYEKLIYDGLKFYSIASYSEKLKQQTIVVNGMSKTYSMTGFRIGYLAANKEIVAAVNSMQSHSTSNACSIAQAASVAALDGDPAIVDQMVEIFDSRRKYILTRLKNLTTLKYIMPRGAFYCFVDFSYYIGKKHGDAIIFNSLTLANMLLDAGVAVIPGGAFGFDNFVRLSYAISLEDIKEGFDRIEKFLSEVE